MSADRKGAIAAFGIRAVSAVGWRIVQFADRLHAGPETKGERTLAGDREIEWSWSLAQLPSVPGRVLDFGAGNGVLSLGAALHGHSVVAVDLEPCMFPFDPEGIEYRRGDINELEFELDSFDYVINCSTVEHVGLPGRYSGSSDDSEADLRAMEKLARVMKPGAEMGLTLPVGQDAVFSPLHRVYGPKRLPRLIAPFEIISEEFWAKPRSNLWQSVDRESALAQQCSRSFYALGLFRLRRPR